MKIQIYPGPDEAARHCAEDCSQVLNDHIQNQGGASLLLSTGKSQIPTLRYLVQMDVDWSKVTMFHLDEYVGLPANHPASFRRYLQERFVDLVSLKKKVFVNGQGDLDENIDLISREVRHLPVDVALVGIGENGHIAFNDPPADFETDESYIVVNLDDRCKQQQVGEGWFSDISKVPNQAVTMTVNQILKSKHILSCVPYAVKATAVSQALQGEVSPNVPASILKTHPNVTLYLDHDSSAKLTPELLAQYS